MNCSKCGAEIAEDQKFCAECGFPFAAQTVTTYQYKGQEYQKEDIIKIAKYQTWVLFGILFNIVLTPILYVGQFALPDILIMAVSLLSIANTIFYIVAFCLLRSAQKGILLVTLLGIILLFIPLVCLIVLLIVNGSATKMLRSAGLKVGLMGVSQVELNEFKNK